MAKNLFLITLLFVLLHASAAAQDLPSVEDWLLNSVGVVERLPDIPNDPTPSLAFERDDHPETLSPDGTYRVFIGDFTPACAGRNVIVIETQGGSRRIATCTDWERVTFGGWLDNDRLLMRYDEPPDARPPYEELVLLSARTGEAHSFGVELELYEPLSIFDDNSRLVRIADRTTELRRYDTIEVCALNFIDLATFESVDVEMTYCFHQPQIFINEQRRELLYLNHQVTDNERTPLTTPHIVNLDTHEVTPLPISGIVVDIMAISSDWNRFAFLVDNELGAGRGEIWGFNGRRRYVNPRWLVYDRAANAITYERPLLENLDDQPIEASILDIATPGFEWTPMGWRTILVTSNGYPPVLLESINGEVSEMLLDLPANAYGFSFEHVEWSADGRHVLVQIFNDGVYVVERTTTSVTPIADQIDGIHFGASWYDSSQLLIEVNSYDSPVIQRWLINLYDETEQ